MSSKSKKCPACPKGVIVRANTNQKFEAICEECAGYIRRGKEAARLERERPGRDYNLPRVWPVINGPADTFDHTRELRRALAEALIAVAPPQLVQGGYLGAVHQYLPRADGEGASGRVKVLISDDAAEKIRRLDAELTEAINRVHAAAFLDGQNLLKQLAVGSIGTEKFDSVVDESRATLEGRGRRSRG